MSNKKAPDTKAKLDWIAREEEGEREGREGEQHTQSRTKTKTETIGVLISVRVQLQFRAEGAEREECNTLLSAAVTGIYLPGNEEKTS